jgi:hypothetical protein
MKLLPEPTIWSQSKKDESRCLWKVWYRIVALMIWRGASARINRFQSVREGEKKKKRKDVIR